MALIWLILVQLATYTSGFLFNNECETFDYIVVGAGSAGATVANRLSEDPNTSVLLLEAGDNPIPILSQVPFFAVLQQKTGSDWQYLTEPQKDACKALVDQKMYLPTGRVLGGTSTLNEMMYVRGNRKDYDDWAKMGATGWSYDEVSPYFLKSEGNTDPELANSPYHNTSGLLTVSTQVYHTPLRDAFLNGLLKMNYPLNDYNGARQTGCSKVQTTIKKGERWSTKKAFLDSAKNRRNLVVRTGAHVFQIEFDNQKRATGVKYYDDILLGLLKTEKQACARKEIVVSCGAIRSPQLLMLSGIGSKQHLQDMGIPVVSDLPGVGENLMDHYGSPLYVQLKTSKPVSLQPWRLIKPTDIGNYLITGNGPLSLPSAIEALAFINTKYANSSEDYPDIELVHASIVYLFRETKLEVQAKVYPQGIPDGFLLFPFMTHVKSKGFVKLRSKDSLVNPIIDTNYLSDKRDLETLKEGLRFAYDLVKNGAYDEYNPRIIPVPGCDSEIGSDEWLECSVRTFTYSTYHLGGTCKMGKVSDSMTVVDPQLRVKGVTGLRVADCSIMPEVNSGNTNAPAIMIGEKAADLIKAANQRSGK